MEIVVGSFVYVASSKRDAAEGIAHVLDLCVHGLAGYPANSLATVLFRAGELPRIVERARLHEIPTRDEIRAFRSVASERGDRATVELCDRVLSDETGSRPSDREEHRAVVRAVVRSRGAS